MIEHIKRVWRGEEKLWKVFWLWGVLGNGIFIYTPLYCDNFLHFIIIFFFFPISAFLILKNSKNTKNIKYKTIARAAIILAIILYATTFIFITFWIYFWSGGSFSSVISDIGKCSRLGIY